MRQDRIENMISMMGAIERLGLAGASQIVEATQLSGSSVNVILGYLSDNEYVTISRKKMDGRRQMYYSLTERGFYRLAVAIDPAAAPRRGELTKALFGTRLICGDFERPV